MNIALHNSSSGLKNVLSTIQLGTKFKLIETILQKMKIAEADLEWSHSVI